MCSRSAQRHRLHDMDLLTNSVNVPAEREKLRRLRDEIAADVELRKQIERKYTPRWFLRADYVQDEKTQIGGAQ